MTEESTTANKGNSAAKKRRNRKKKAKNKRSESQKEEERQKELEFSKLNNHAKLRSDLIAQGFTAQQIDNAMDEMWNQNMPYDEYEQVLKYLKEGGKKTAPAPAVTPAKKVAVQKITEADDDDDDDDDDDGGVEETKEVEAADLTPSQVVTKAASPKRQVATSPKRQGNLNSMAARLDLVAGFDSLPDAIFAMTEWIAKAAKPHELEELCASVETVALSKIIRRSITESTSQAQFDSTILPSMVRLLENLLQKCGMPASGDSNSFPSILQQARQVYQMKKAGSEGIPQRVAEFMVARMYVILKESRNAQSKGLDALPKSPAAKAGEIKKDFAAMYSERETHRIVAKQFGAAALASCRAIASSKSNGISAHALEAAKTDIFSAIIDEDTNAAFHQHESMYTELKAQVSQEESKEENNQTLVILKQELNAVQTERNGLASQIAALQKQIAQLETQDQELVTKQYKIQEQMDHERDQQSDETKKLNEALKEASIQLQSDEYVKSLVDLLKDFDDALAARSVQAISQGASPQEKASKAMDYYLTRAKNYFESEAHLFQLLQKRIVTNQSKVSEMKRDIEMCQGLGMTTTIKQMEEDIKSAETMMARDKSLVSRIRSDSAAMLNELMVWLEEYNTARDKDPKRLVPISDKLIQAIPREVSKLEIPNGDRLDAFLAIHDIVHLQPPTLSFDHAEEQEVHPEEPKKVAAPKFTWAKSPANVATNKTKKSLLDIQKEEMESKKEEEATVAEEVEEAKKAEPEEAVKKPEESQAEEKTKKEAATPSAAPEASTTTAEPAASSAPAEPLSSPTEAPAVSSETRNSLVFPCFLAPPTGTTLSMPFAPFRKEDEGATDKNQSTSTTILPDEERLNAQIAELAEKIKKAKQENKPKEEWDPMLKEMLALKAKFKEVIGKDHGRPIEEKKPKNSGQQEASDKNKEKRAAKAAAKAEKEAEKAAKRAERERREREKADKLAGVGQDNFGDTQTIQSQEITDKKWVEVANLKPSLAGHKVLIRGYLQTCRDVGKGVFVLIRSTLYTVQGVAFQNETVSQGMIKYISGLPIESVVEVEGTITVPENPVESATQRMVEIQITAFHCVSKAKQALPFLMEDACRPDEKKEDDVGAYDENAEVQREDGLVRVGDKNRLDNRWLDLRTPANQSIMRIESMVGCLFRECLLSKGFIEIHTPKLIGGSSEGGADVFTLDYFGRPACLAMSPQLHKQMAAACSGFERVFTTGPVFRAENSNTRRHLCEFTGFDMEMAIHEHYDEVMDVFSDLFIHIFDGINERCKAELERVREQHPFEDLKYLRPTLKITYAEGCALLREAGIEQDDYEDLSTENEKKLGNIVKEKYDTDFFFMDKYPLSVRPFYTMPCPDNPKLSNSYDFFIRGQEILSGAQRIHEPDFIEERAKAWGIDLSTIEEYVNSFRNGALPHGGGGIGLERVVMLFLGLPNIRKAAWFPRDPRRLAP